MAEQLDLFADNFTDGGAVEWTDAALDEKLDRISNALAQSPTGRALLEWAADNDVVVVFDAQLSASYAASYRPQSNAVVMSPHTDEDFLVSLLAHELRHATLRLSEQTQQIGEITKGLDGTEQVIVSGKDLVSDGTTVEAHPLEPVNGKGKA